MFGLNPASTIPATIRRQRQLGRELRRLYCPVASEPVPEDMLEQLKEIDRATVEEAPRRPRKRHKH
jgi:hypothetical protein